MTDLRGVFFRKTILSFIIKGYKQILSVDVFEELYRRRSDQTKPRHISAMPRHMAVADFPNSRPLSHGLGECRPLDVDFGEKRLLCRLCLPRLPALTLEMYALPTVVAAPTTLSSVVRRRVAAAIIVVETAVSLAPARSPLSRNEHELLTRPFAAVLRTPLHPLLEHHEPS